MMATKTSTAQTSRVLRPFSSTDTGRIVDICKNVYGGTDYMPRLITHFAEQPDVTILVSQDEGSHVDGVVCGSKRSDCMFLFGLRVCEAARGKGVARTLMADICRRAAAEPGVATITSATIPQNPAAMRIFSGLGFSHSHTVDVWPAYAALHEYEAAVGFVPGQSPAQPGSPSMLDSIPGVRQLTAQAAQELGVAPSDWQRCSCSKQLAQAVLDVRLQQLQHPDMHQVPADAPLDWLPWVYESQPLAGSWTTDRLLAGDIWMLHTPSNSTSSSLSTNSSLSSGGSTSLSSLAHAASGSSICSSASSSPLPAAAAAAEGGSGGGGQPRCQGVVVTGWSPEFRRHCAGILTAGNALLPAALEFVFCRLPHAVCLCDRGNRHSSSGPDPDAPLPAVLSVTGAPSCFLVYSRPANGSDDTGCGLN